MPALKDKEGKVYMNVCTREDITASMKILLGKSGSKQVFEALVREVRKLGFS